MTSNVIELLEAARLQQAVAERITNLENAALRRYATAYNQDLYMAAIEGQGRAYSQAVLYQAFALCGSMYARTNDVLVQNAGIDVLRFWEPFTKWEIPNSASTPLIDAAPDLLEALQEALTVIEVVAYMTGSWPETRDSNGYKKARAAIAKAKGESPA